MVKAIQYRAKFLTVSLFLKFNQEFSVNCLLDLFAYKTDKYCCKEFRITLGHGQVAFLGEGNSDASKA